LGENGVVKGTMKIRILKLKNWLLMTLVGALGLGACHSTKNITEPQPPEEPQVDTPKPRDPVVVMYGVPTMNFVVKGKVINEQGKPVKGLQVILLNRNADITPEEMHEDNEYIREYIQRASDTTDAEGNYMVRTSDTPAEKQQMIVRDIDGEKNGKYKSLLLDIDYREATQTEERQGWNMGTREKVEDVVVEIEN